MSHLRHLTVAALCGGALLTPALAGAGSDRVTVLPPQVFGAKLPDVKARSGLKVLLPSKARVLDLTAGARRFHRAVYANGHAYRLTLVNRACAKAAPCRRILSFRASRTSDKAGGDIRLAKGRVGVFALGSCTGGGCTPPSISWIERGARYTLYAYVGDGSGVRGKLSKIINDAIRNGPR